VVGVEARKDVDPMHKSASPRRKRAWLLGLAGSILLGLAATGAFLVGVTPAMAAALASQPDTQVAVFMVPLALLILVLLYEVARIAWRDAVPAPAPHPRRRRPHWASGRSAG